MTSTTHFLWLVPAAYLAGSIPFGLLVGWSRGVDVRQTGSGNIGATNVARVLGSKRWFFLVFFLDLLKGMTPALTAGALLHFAPATILEYFLWLLTGFSAIAGHMFPIFIGFKGGKGVATSCGVVLGIWPYCTLPAIAALTVFYVVMRTSRYVSLGSIAAAASFPVLYLAFALWRWPSQAFHEQLPLLFFALLVAVMIIMRHRANIVRLRAGTEARFAPRVRNQD